MKHLRILPGLLLMVVGITQPIFPYVVGVGFEGAGGDTPVGESTMTLVNIYGFTDYVEMWGGQHRLYGELSLFPGQRRAAEIAYAHDLFIYGPAAYVGMIGYAVNDRRQDTFFARIRYQEMFFSPFFYYGQFSVNFPNFAHTNQVTTEVALGLTVFFDSKPKPSPTERAVYLDFSEIVARNSKIQPGEIREDRTSEIQALSSLTKAAKIQIPKFVKVGVPFTISKSFTDASVISSVSAKIEGLPNRLFNFKQVSSTEWATSVTLPASFADPQVNITVTILSKDGTKLEEFASTLVSVGL